jgi:hypothetical protein
MSLWQSIQELRARALEAQQGATMACQRARIVCQHAQIVRLERFMPGANGLTLTITAAILAGRGLLDRRPAPRRVPAGDADLGL